MVKTVLSFQFLCSKLQLLIIKILYVLPTPHFQTRHTYADPRSTKDFSINLLAPELCFFLILAHPVYKK